MPNEQVGDHPSRAHSAPVFADETEEKKEKKGCWFVLVFICVS
jgi:hypothetical protein